jgi:hypothetical protein
VVGANLTNNAWSAQYSVFKALGLKIKLLDGSLVFINLENSIGFGAEFALLEPHFLVRG